MAREDKVGVKRGRLLLGRMAGDEIGRDVMMGRTDGRTDGPHPSSLVGCVAGRSG